MRARYGIPLVLLALSIAILAALVAAPAANARPPGCDRVVSVAAGGEGAVQMIDSLDPGQTGCLRDGTYRTEQFELEVPGIRLKSYPGEHATLLGRLRIDASADRAVVEGLTLDARTSDHSSPLIYADRVTLRANEITNDHGPTCVLIASYPGVGPPDGVLIERNRIHDCGRLPATNHDHGIYVAHAHGTVIRNNWIYDNADRGVQLYPDADGTLVTGNVIDGNGQGVIFGGGGSSSSDDNVVERNLITNSTIRSNIAAHWQGPTGSGNVARENCVWAATRAEADGPGGIESPSVGFEAYDNLVAEPSYVDADAGEFRLEEGSACLDIAGDGEASGDRGTRGKCGTPMHGTRVGDVIFGTRDRDRIEGRGGVDRIKGRAGKDCLFGGRGQDRISARDGVRDRVRCGAGSDIALVDGRDNVRGCERVRDRH